MLSSSRILGRVAVSRRFAHTYTMVKSNTQLEELVQQPGNKILYFTATWCPPCRLIAPIFEKLSKEYASTKFLKIDIDENADSAENYGIQSVPTFIFMNDQTVKSQFSGANESLLRSNLNQLEGKK